jgi:hypothetical protein
VTQQRFQGAYTYIFAQRISNLRSIDAGESKNTRLRGKKPEKSARNRSKMTPSASPVCPLLHYGNNTAKTSAYVNSNAPEWLV